MRATAYRLTVQPIPPSTWRYNLHTKYPEHWERIRSLVYRRAKYVCEICGTRSRQLSAHEVWQCNYGRRRQVLQNVICVCDDCHNVIHWYGSRKRGVSEFQLVNTFCRVNGCTPADCLLYLDSLNTNRERRIAEEWTVSWGAWNAVLDLDPRRLTVRTIREALAS